MAIVSLDIARFEHGQGAGKVTRITGNATASPVVRNTAGFGTTPVLIGNADGYDLSSANSLRLFYDVKLGTANFFDLFVVPAAADPGSSGEPVPIGADFFLTPFLPVLSGVAGPLKPGSGAIRFDSDQRGTITIPRSSLLVRFEAATDQGTPTGEIALSAQSILAVE